MATVNVFTAEKMQEVADAIIVSAEVAGNTLILHKEDTSTIEIDMSGLGGGGGGPSLPTVGYMTDSGDVTDQITIVNVDDSVSDVINLTLPDSPAGTSFTIMVFGSWSPGSFDDKGVYVAGNTMDLPINDGGGLMLYVQNFASTVQTPTMSATFVSDGDAWHVASTTYPEAEKIPVDLALDFTPALSATNVEGAIVELHGLILDASSGAITTTIHTDNYTLVLSDAGTVVEMNKATAVTLTIPPEADVAFPVGTVLEINQVGAGQVTVAPGAGVALHAPNGAKTALQYSSVGIRKRASNEWVLSGDSVV